MIGYRFHPAAEAEYHQAIRHYSRVREELGLAFVATIEGTITRLREQPFLHTGFHSGLRRAFAKRFPFWIIYEVRQDDLIIWAVAHASRRPGYWWERLQE